MKQTHVEVQTATVALADVDFEEQLLGALLADGELIADTIMERLEPGHFFVVRYGWLYDVLRELHARGDGADYALVVDEMRRRKVSSSTTMLEEFGGPPELTRLVAFTRPATASEVRALARVIRQYAEKRALLAFCSQLAQQVYEGDKQAFELWSDGMDALTRLRPHAGADEVLLGRDSIAYYDQLIEHEIANPIWYPPPWRALREAAPASKPGDILIISGPEGSGKSAMAFNWAQFCAEALSARTLYIHTEMDSANVLARRKVANSTMSYHKLIAPDELTQADLVEFHRADENIARWAHNLDTWEAGAIQARELLSRVKAHVDTYGTRVVVIDGLNDLDFQVPRSATLAETVRKFMARLETFARENNLLVIGTVQLNREGQEFGSSAYRQKAALLLAIETEIAQTPQTLTYQGVTYGCETGEGTIFRKVRVAKNRRGKSGQKIELAFIGARFLWIDPPGAGEDAPRTAPLHLGE